MARTPTLSPWPRDMRDITTLVSTDTRGLKVGFSATATTWDLGSQIPPGSLGSSVAMESVGPTVAPLSVAAQDSKFGVTPGIKETPEPPEGAEGRWGPSPLLCSDGHVPCASSTVACELELGLSAVLKTSDSDPEIPLTPMGSVAISTGVKCTATFLSREACGLDLGCSALLSPVGLAPPISPKSALGELGLAPACMSVATCEEAVGLPAL